jgi:hypothetical protein
MCRYHLASGPMILTLRVHVRTAHGILKMGYNIRCQQKTGKRIFFSARVSVIQMYVLYPRAHAPDPRCLALRDWLVAMGQADTPG